MPLTSNIRSEIKSLLIKKIDNKLNKYKRETTALPFLTRLIQDSEKVAAYSFIHSIATSLGMSIYENISVIISQNSSKECFRNYGVGGAISPAQKRVINKIVNELRQRERKANIKKEITEILNASTYGAKYQKSGNVADFYMQRKRVKYFFEIKTAKPNIDVFEKSKTKLLEWVARKQARIKVFLVIPYNPYYPEQYDRFTKVGMMDPPNDLLIGSEYWDFLGGKGTFNVLLNIFDEVGKIYKQKLAAKFKELSKIKYENY